MLTRTQIKNGQKIEAAALRVALAGEGVWRLHFTVGQVARESGMSKPTVQKYLDLLAQHKIIREIERDMRYCLKNTPKSYVWQGTLEVSA